MHDRLLIHLEGGFRCREPITEGAVWPLGVIVAPPVLDDDLGFPKRVEDLAVQEFVSEPGIEALRVAVLPR